MKEDSIEICTINCASLHSLLCMRKEARVEPAPRERNGRSIFKSDAVCVV